MAPFVELSARSAFSFLEGASQPEELVARAAELRLDGLALTDRDGLFGMVRAHVEAKRLGQRLLVGASVLVRPEGVGEPTRVRLLVDDARGYANLSALLTVAHAETPLLEPGEEDAPSPVRAELPSVALAELLARPEGLRAVVATHAFLARPGELAPLLDALRGSFEARVAVSTHRHGAPADALRDELARAAAARGFPVVATAEPLFHEASRKPVADVLHCIRHHTTLDRAGQGLLASAEAALRSGEQMRRRFRDEPAWVEETVRFSDPVRFSMGSIRYRFPGLTLAAPGETVDETLRRLVAEGAARRYPGGTPAAVRAQLDKELALISRLDVAPYFLSVHQIVEMARSRRILCQGRGSAANSAVCFVLGVTSVDPARANLLFERFLSAERAEPPDIDVDFEHERREEVIQAIYREYGRGRAAMVSEVIAYRLKSAVREVGKAFGLSLEQIDRLSAVAPGYYGGPAGGLPEKRVREIGLDPGDPRLRKAMILAQQIEGFPRHLSIHVGGFVLSADPLDAVAPVQPASMPGRTVIPWDKDDIEDLGFFKVDVLGLGMLTAIRKCLAEVHAHAPRSDAFDPIEALAAVPAEDPAVYGAVSRADTIGVFQIESRAQQAMLPRLRPAEFYDLVIEVAIVRPGPIQGGMVHPYLRRRQGKEPADAPHPCLEPILARTLGVPLFQEQVMQISMVGAGYTAGEADQLRRDMAAWKKHGRLARHRERLLRGFAERGISEAFGERLYQQIHGFGEYGFPESHAASFAILVYVSAWLKVHHPAAFLLALLNAQPMGFYSASALVQDAQRHGVRVLPPDVLASGWDNRLEPDGAGDPTRVGPVRLGLRQIRGLGEGAARAIEALRARGGLGSIHDLAVHAGLARDALEALAEAGALERLAGSRRAALWLARSPRAEGLFHGLSLEGERPPPALPPLEASEQLALDYGRVGLSVDDHPMRHLRASFGKRRVLRARDLERVRHGGRVQVAGLVVGRQRPQTASGVTFVTLEDETGMANLVVWRDVFERFHAIVQHATFLLVKGKIEREGGDAKAPAVIHVVADAFERLELDALRPPAAERRPDAFAGRSRDYR